MATTDSEHYVRLTLLTQQGGILISKQILLREVDALPNKPGLAVFLKGHKTHFELKKRHHDITFKQYKILFPSGGYDTDIEEWDLQLLIKVILDLFNLTGRQTSDLQEILRIRNEIICHAKQPAISDQEFLSNWTKIVGCMNRLSVTLDSAIAEQASTLIDNFGTGPLCLQTSLDKLSALCRNDEHMEHVLQFLARIDRGQNVIASTLASHDIKLEELLDRVKKIQCSMTPAEACKIDIPSLQTNLCINGAREENVKTVEDFVLRVLKAAIDKADDPNDEETIKCAMKEIIQKIEGNDAVVVSAKTGSILINIQCNTLSGLQKLLMWLKERECKLCLQNLEKALEGNFQSKFKAVLTLSKDAILKLSDWSDQCMLSHNNSDSEELPFKTKVNIAVKCKSTEAVSRVVKYLTHGDSANILNTLSETLSTELGDRIRVHAAFDTEKLLADLEKVEKDLSKRKMAQQLRPHNEIDELKTSDLKDEDGDSKSCIKHSSPLSEGGKPKMSPQPTISRTFNDPQSNCENDSTEKSTSNSVQWLGSLAQADPHKHYGSGTMATSTATSATTTTTNTTAATSTGTTTAGTSTGSITAPVFHPTVRGSYCLVRENQRLLQEIFQICGRQDRHGVENVLLIGKSGAGKSALVNTLIKAITGDYYDRPKVGSGITQSKTLHIIQYKSCGVQNDDIRIAGDDCPFSDWELRKLPTVYEVPGLDDDLEDDTREILRLLIAGRIPVGTGISGLQKLQNEHGIGSLDIIFDTIDPRAKISKIVFVQSAVDSVPRNLIEGLHSVLGETDSSTARLIYEGDVFLVITHYDLVQDDLDPSESAETLGRREADDADISRRQCDVIPDSQIHETSTVILDLARTRSRISRSEFEKKEELLASLFSIGGALERNRMFWMSFCDATGYHDPAICNNALKLLTFMMKPTAVVVIPEKRAQLKAKKFKKQFKESYDKGDFKKFPGVIFLALIFALVAYFVFRALSASPDRR